MKLYIWNEHCVMSGRVDRGYEPEDLYEIQTFEDGAWAADTIGENEPRSYDECMEDIAAFRRGEAGQEFAAAFSDEPEPDDDTDEPNVRCEWRIQPTGDTDVNGDHTTFEAESEADMIAEAREYLREHPDNSWRSRAYRNILDYLNAPIDPAGEIAEGDFVILFDNGGGALFMTRTYTHSYSFGEQLAEDVKEFLSSGSTADWDGDEPECRREIGLPGDDVMWREDVESLLAPGADLSSYGNGFTRKRFVEALTGLEVEA